MISSVIFFLSFSIVETLSYVSLLISLGDWGICLWSNEFFGQDVKWNNNTADSSILPGKH